MSDFDQHARFYDLEHDDYQYDVSMYAGFATLAGPDMAVLELACGTGRLLLPLASTGSDVTGLDISPAMLHMARQKLEAAGLAAQVTLVQADMRAFSLGRRFGLIFVALNSLMHLDTRAAQQAAIDCAARHLAPGGRLILDLFNPDDALPDPLQEGQLYLHCIKTPPGGHHLLHFQSPRVDRGTQIVSVTNIYDEIASDGAMRRQIRPFTLRYVTRGELELMVEAAGLHLEMLYGSYDLDPFEGDSPRLIAVARHGGQ